VTDEAVTDEALSVALSRPTPEIAVVTLNRPERLNALDYGMVEVLTSTIADLGRDRACRAIVLTGAGRGFCAGLDLVGAKARDEGNGRGSIERLEGQETFAAMVRTIRAVRHPVIAAVNGPAAGAGMALALACDVRVMAEAASLHVAAVKLGITAGECAITYHLPRHIGSGKAFEILLTGRPIDASEAERLGLVSHVVSEGGALDAAIDVARRIVANSPYSVWQTKRLMWSNLDAPFDHALELENRSQVIGSFTSDHLEAVRAFNDRRDPHFSGT
jgi:enoyl-CoA hydratase